MLKLPFILLLLLLSYSIAAAAGDADDAAELDELLAVDAEEEKARSSGEKHPEEADLLSRAQRIVVQVTNENVGRVVNGSEYVLVLGYAPWCLRSAEIMPNFAEAATALRELGSGVVLAKLDAERHHKAAEVLGIKGFPTLLLFVNGTQHAYTGGFTGDDVVIWVRKKTGFPVINLSSTAAAQEILKKYPTVVLGLFKMFQGANYDEFVKAAISNEEIQFVATTELEVAAVIYPDVKLEDNFIGLIKNEPERYVTYGGPFEEEKILEFLNYNKFPLVTKLTEFNSLRVYTSIIKRQVFIFGPAQDYEILLQSLLDVAKKFVSKILIIYVDSKEENLAKPFLTIFGLEPEPILVAAFDSSIGSKYLLEAELTTENLEEFCTKLSQGTLAPYYKSQPIPDNVATVKEVVGKTFDEVVLTSSENVLLEVYAPWCITCEAMTKKIDKLANHFKSFNNLTFARIDASSNEHPKLEVADYPTLLFYPAEDKSKPVKISNKFSLKDLASVVKHKVQKTDANADTLASEHTTKDEL